MKIFVGLLMAGLCCAAEAPFDVAACVKSGKSVKECTDIQKSKLPAMPAVPQREQIPQKYMTLFGGLIAQTQAFNKSITEAQTELQGLVCDGKKIAADDCEVNWQQGTFGKKFVPPPPVAPVTPGPKPPVAPVAPGPG